MTYPRPLRAALLAALQDTPVVSLLGPRQCGKTTLARTLEPDYAYFSLDDDTTLAFATSDPAGFVAGLPNRVILDEVQRAPALLRTLKLEVDRDRRPGRFVLTGSADLLMLPKLGDSLTGRMEIINLQPLSAAELNRQPGGLVAALLNGTLAPKARVEPGGFESLAGYVVAGGFPEAVARPADRARAWHRNYLRTLVERDALDISKLRDGHVLQQMLALLALQTAELLNVTRLSNELGVSRATVDSYLEVSERLFLLRRLQPWHRNQAKRLVKTPKMHFVDTGLASMLADLGTEDWVARRHRFGHMLESWVVQQIIAQAGWTDPDLRFWHYRDKDQVEVDLVVTRGSKTWAVEVKSAMTVLPQDGHGLRRLANQCGNDFQGGMLLYAGASVLPLSTSGCHAVPLSCLWEM